MNSDYLVTPAWQPRTSHSSTVGSPDAVRERICSRHRSAVILIAQRTLRGEDIEHKAPGSNRTKAPPSNWRTSEWTDWMPRSSGEERGRVSHQRRSPRNPGRGQPSQTGRRRHAHQLTRANVRSDRTQVSRYRGRGPGSRRSREPTPRPRGRGGCPGIRSSQESEARASARARAGNSSFRRTSR